MLHLDEIGKFVGTVAAALAEFVERVTIVLGEGRQTQVVVLAILMLLLSLIFAGGLAVLAEDALKEILKEILRAALFGSLLWTLLGLGRRRMEDTISARCRRSAETFHRGKTAFAWA